MAKMKLKTHSGAKKRFKLTKNGKIKRGHAFRSHILTKKTTKLTRGYRQPNYVDKTNAATTPAMSASGRPIPLCISLKTGNTRAVWYPYICIEV